MIQLAVFLSGACALTYQFVWLRSFAVIFGGTTRAASLVLAVFMAGLALGSYLAKRIRLQRVLRAYAFSELGMGLSALASFPILKALPNGYGAFLQSHPLPEGPELALKACLAAAVVLPTAMLSGATLPLALESLARRGKNLHAQFSSLYRLNTLGAAGGVALATFFLIPSLGLSRSLALAAFINIGMGLLVWGLGKEGEVPADAAETPSRPAPLLALASAASGAGAFILELLWMRSLALVIGSSVYAFNLMLLSMLLGMACGTWIYERYWKRWADPGLWLAALSLALGLGVLLQEAFIGQLPALYVQLISHLPASFLGYQSASFALCFFTLLPITCLQGLCFPLLTHLQGPAEGSAQEASGRLYAWNTLGAVVGALAAGFYLIPHFGLQATYVVAAAPALFIAALLWKKGPLPFLALALGLALLGHFYRPWDPYAMSSGPYIYGKKYKELMPPGSSFGAFLRTTGDLLFYKEGSEAVVSARAWKAVHSLQINGKTDASYGQDSITQKLVAHIPLLMHPSPRSVAVIGWGSGTTAASVALHPLERIDCVEIEPATWEAAPYFEEANRGLKPGGNFSLYFEDGRSFLLKSPRSYDVIVSEPSNPWIHGISNLFTYDYYEVAKSRLAPGGIFGQWFHFYAMGLEDVKNELNTFAQAFPYACVWMIPRAGTGYVTGDLCLLGSREPMRLDEARLQALFKDAGIKADLESVGISDPLALAGAWLMERPDMEAFAAAARINSDDLPLLEHSAPRFLQLSVEDSDALTLKNCLALGGAASAWKPPVVGGPGLKSAEILQLGRLYSDRREDKKAEQALLEALRLDPASREAADLLGKLYYRGERYELSRDSYLALSRRLPRDAEAWFGLGASLAHLRDWEGSKKALERCLALDPGHGLARQFLEQMNKNIAAGGH